MQSFKKRGCSDQLCLIREHSGQIRKVLTAESTNSNSRVNFFSCHKKSVTPSGCFILLILVLFKIVDIKKERENADRGLGM
jgi:hypothetical protein